MATLVLGWGCNEDGQASSHSAAKDAAESCVSSPEVVVLPYVVEIVQVAAGSRHSIALSAAGEVFTWGWGKQGQLGQPHRNTVLRPMRVDALQNIPIVQISAGGIHSAAVARTGELYTWGENSYGQLGRESGDALGPGLVTVQAEDGSAMPFLAVSVACGGMHTAALQEDGSVWCWGRSDSGQVGVKVDWVVEERGVTLGVVTPQRVQLPPVSKISCGAFHTAAVTLAGELWTWGKEDYGMLGFDLGLTADDGLYVPTKVEALTGIQVTDVACGGWHTVCLAEGGAVYVFGRGEYGRLGLGDDRSRATPVKLASLDGIEVVQATTGGTHTMLLSATREVFVMGRGSLGRLGLGTTTTHSTPQRLDHPWFSKAGVLVRQISCGGAHSLALLQVSEELLQSGFGANYVDGSAEDLFRSPLPSPTAPSPLLKDVLASNNRSQFGRQL